MQTSVQLIFDMIQMDHILPSTQQRSIYNSTVYVRNTLTAWGQQNEIRFTAELGSLKQQFNSAYLLHFPTNPIARIILNQSIAVHLLTHYLSKTQSIIILPSISRSATWSLLLRPSVKKKSYVV